MPDKYCDILNSLSKSIVQILALLILVRIAYAHLDTARQHALTSPMQAIAVALKEPTTLDTAR